MATLLASSRIALPSTWPRAATETNNNNNNNNNNNSNNSNAMVTINNDSTTTNNSNNEDHKMIQEGFAQCSFDVASGGRRSTEYLSACLFILAIFYPFSQFCEINMSLLSLQKQPNTAPNLFQRGVEYGKYVISIIISGSSSSSSMSISIIISIIISVIISVIISLLVSLLVLVVL